MEMKEWLNVLKHTKPNYTFLTMKDFKLYKYPDKFKIVTETKCKDKDCNCVTRKGVSVYFHNMPKELSTFQVELLYNVFVRNKKPYDYASYHTCPAGIEFISNIKGVETL